MYSATNPKNHLRRGQACFNCRSRKMRCDGAHPICGQCERGNRPDDCEYVGAYTRSKVQILQENIAHVENRIYELEHPLEAQPGFRLQQPYSSASTSHHPGAAHSAQTDNLGNAAEPPMEMVQKLIDYFLPHAADFGFFLHPSRFRRDALMHYPTGHHARPSPAVLLAVYLWGLRLSNHPNLMAQEPAFLARALDFTAKSLSSTHPHKAIHNLQAEILLAYYFFACGRFLEGKYHTSAAVALALSSSLYVIRSANVQSSPPRDTLEEGERIHACWVTTILDTLWAAALRQEPTRDLRNDSKAFFDTPWPLELGDYEMASIPSCSSFHLAQRYSRTVYKFLTGAPGIDTNLSTTAVLAKASILWQQAEGIARGWNPNMALDQAASIQAAFGTLDNRIEAFRAALGPPGCIANPTPAMTRALIVAHSVTHAATIQLHSMSVIHTNMDSRRKRVSSGGAVLEIIVETAPRQNIAHINPIMGVRVLLSLLLNILAQRRINLVRTDRVAACVPGRYGRNPGVEGTANRIAARTGGRSAYSGAFPRSGRYVSVCWGMFAAQ
ncbi:hypothetical protein DFH07DRAFT_753467 [Mycena maculata]|uniref:Zn(2)-C6 fungal-type domain-containing protein n=1 Tax=Mycena maculata TaxID=230809 RepID=A0AAD7MWY1_9AGAR|nr:hypothetical protein DFH07DRAFT_753467 [Mycena maculata]